MVDFNSSHKIIATKHNDNLLHCLAECLTISHCGGVRFSKEQPVCVLLELYSENDSAAVMSNAERWTENVVTWFKTVEQKGNNLKRKEVVNQHNDIPLTLLRQQVKVPLVFITALGSGDTGSCEAPFLWFENGCYILVTEKKPWQEAEDYCHGYGNNVHLVPPDTQQVPHLL